MQFHRADFEIKSVKKDAGTFDAILSTPTLDRDGEVVDSKAFEPLPDHIPIDIDHGMSTTTIVGSGRPYYDGDTLKFEGSFASTTLGQEVRTLVTEGHVRKMSVAYRDARYEVDEKDGLPHLRKAELVNAAIVPIPANRQADILAAKSFLQAGSVCAACGQAPTDPEEKTAAEPAAVEPPADVVRALIELRLAEAQLAL